METQPIEISTKDNLVLKGNFWSPASKAVGAVCLLHGLGEHTGRYRHVVSYLAGYQLAVMAVDLRGHGTSGGKRGHIPSYALLMDDVDRMLRTTKDLCPDLPLFLYGHSMGGGIAANFVLRNPQKGLAGVVIASPWLKLAFVPSVFKITLARLVHQVFPSFTQPNTLDAHQLSHDPEVTKAYLKDPLVHNYISVAAFLYLQEAGEWAIRHAGELNIPALIMHGNEDTITLMAASREFAEKGGVGATLKIWNGLRHETHNEYQQTDVLTYIRDWLLGQIQQVKP